MIKIQKLIQSRFSLPSLKKPSKKLEIIFSKEALKKKKSPLKSGARQVFSSTISVAIVGEVLAWQDGRIIKDKKIVRKETLKRKDRNKENIFIDCKVLMCRMYEELLEISKKN